MNDIYRATEQRCREEQDEARSSHFYAVRYLDQNLHGLAIQEQRNAAYHAAEARMRLFRLIGTE